jgi:penicillin-binding protein 1A
MNFKPLTYFWIVVFLLLFYNYFQPLSSKDLGIAYSCLIIADDEKGTIIGTINAVSFQNDTLRRVNIPKVEKIPSKIREAVLASEDRSFFKDWRTFVGFNFRGLMRATVKGDGGGSGIEQQLVRTLFLEYPYYNNLNRKVTELLVGINIAKTYSRDELFLTYLNNVPFTSNISGFRTAAAQYFGKSPDKLTWGEVATLVGAVRSPQALTSNEKARKFRDAVLEDLLSQNVISKETYDKIKLRKVNLKNLDTKRKNKAYFNDDVNDFEGYFIRYVKNEVQQILGKKTNFEGLRIVTTYQPNIQKAAEDALENTLSVFPDSVAMPQIGLVSVDIKTGKIRAMIGANPLIDSVGFGTNYAINLRQAGSTFKPFAYGALIQKRKLSLTSSLPDYPIPPYGWNPNNYNGTSSGQLQPLSICLAQSLNIPTANMIKQGLVRPKDVISFARNCGITSDRLPADGPLVLGSGDVTALELASAYSTFANKGVLKKPFSIIQIRDAKNNELYHYTKNRNGLNKKSIKADVALKIKTALEGVITNGTAKAVRNYYKGYAAGKTGTTSEYRDAWFVGFTNELSTAIWFGNDDRSPLPNGLNTGGSTGAPLWGKMMANIKPLKKKSVKDL